MMPSDIRRRADFIDFFYILHYSLVMNCAESASRCGRILGVATDRMVLEAWQRKEKENERSIYESGDRQADEHRYF